MLEVLKESKAVDHLQKINVNDEYGTPFILYQTACLKYDLRPQIDVTASEANHICEYYINKDDDFLARDDDRFDSDCFANFPYSDNYRMFEHAYQLHKKYNNNWLILAYSKTDTRWWHNFVENKAEVHFIQGRVRFKNALGIFTTNSAPYPSCWIIYRKKQRKWRNLLDKFSLLFKSVKKPHGIEQETTR